VELDVSKERALKRANSSRRAFVSRRFAFTIIPAGQYQPLLELDSQKKQPFYFVDIRRMHNIGLDRQVLVNKLRRILIVGIYAPTIAAARNT